MYTIKQLIDELKLHPNQNARVSIVVGDEDENFIDANLTDIHALDVREYVELFVFKKRT